MVLANILLNPLKRMAPTLTSQVMPGGHLVLSGLMLHQANSALAVYRSWGMVPLLTFRVDGWLTLVMRKPLSGS